MSRSHKEKPPKIFKKENKAARQESNSKVRRANAALLAKVLRGEIEWDEAGFEPEPSTSGWLTW